LGQAALETSGRAPAVAALVSGQQGGEALQAGGAVRRAADEAKNETLEAHAPRRMRSRTRAARRIRHPSRSAARAASRPLGRRRAQADHLQFCSRRSSAAHRVGDTWLCRTWKSWQARPSEADFTRLGTPTATLTGHPAMQRRFLPYGAPRATALQGHAACAQRSRRRAYCDP
jgi:hypothetical protein